MITIDKTTSENVAKNEVFGTRLKLARENMRLSIKDAAARLHLNPDIISLLETEKYENAPPKIFLRGYLKSYARMLNFSDADIAYALTQIEMTDPVKLPSLKTTPDPDLQNSPPFMRWATALIILLIVGLVGTWWYTHSQNNDKTLIQATAPIAEPALEKQAPPTAEAATAEAVNSQATLAPAITPTTSTPKAAANTASNDENTDTNSADDDSANDTPATPKPAILDQANPSTNNPDDATDSAQAVETNEAPSDREE